MMDAIRILIKIVLDLYLGIMDMQQYEFFQSINKEYLPILCLFHFLSLVFYSPQDIDLLSLEFNLILNTLFFLGHCKWDFLDFFTR